MGKFLKEGNMKLLYAMFCLRENCYLNVFVMKEYEDSQLFKRDIVDAVKAIGIAWGQNQPKTINKTIIKSWW
jgi:hypothetical protein